MALVLSSITQALHILGPSALLPPLMLARRLTEVRFPDLLADERNFCRTVGDELAEARTLASA